MKAGRELDESIATKIMGWTKNTTLDHLPIYYPPGPPEMNMLSHVVPSYSTDDAAAIMVFHKMLNDLKVQIHFKPASNREYTVEVIGSDQKRLVGPLTFASLPHGICVAAIKAMEKLNEPRP